MDLLHKSVKFEFSTKADGDSRVIEGYGSVFGNIDSTGDIILSGAFAESLTRRMPKMLYQHWSEKLIGRWDEAREDSKGLYIKGTLAKTPLADEAYELAKMGALDGMSIGYSPNDYEHDDKGIRKLKKVELWEVSLVTFPANEAARVTGVKGIETIRQFEEMLQTKLGISVRESVLIASKGFMAARTARESQGKQDDAGEPRNLEQMGIIKSMISDINNKTNLSHKGVQK